MKIFYTLTITTVCHILPTLTYYRNGCLEAHIVSHIPFNHSSPEHNLKDLNDSTVLLNCDKPCHDSIDNITTHYDKYEVLSFKLSEDQFESLNETLDHIIEVEKDDDYIITLDQYISHIKLRLWWTCFGRHAHGIMHHVLRHINKHKLKDMKGYTISNNRNKTESYQLFISNRTGIVLLIKPHYLVKWGETYTKITKFIFGKFEMNFKNFKNHVDVYSLVTLQKYEGDNVDRYQTYFSVWDDGTSHRYDRNDTLSINLNWPDVVKVPIHRHSIKNAHYTLFIICIYIGMCFIMSFGIICWCEMVDRSPPENSV